MPGAPEGLRAIFSPRDLTRAAACTGSLVAIGCGVCPGSGGEATTDGLRAPSDHAVE
jgi:hypothetical protein